MSKRIHISKSVTTTLTKLAGLAWPCEQCGNGEAIHFVTASEGFICHHCYRASR